MICNQGVAGSSPAAGTKNSTAIITAYRSTPLAKSDGHVAAMLRPVPLISGVFRWTPANPCDMICNMRSCRGGDQRCQITKAG